MSVLRLPAWLGTGLATVALATAAWAQVYQWTDAEGRTHYSDSLPGEKSQPGEMGRAGAAGAELAQLGKESATSWRFEAPSGDTYDLEMPAGWLAFSRSQLEVFEGAAARSGTPVPYQTGYYLAPGARRPPYLLVSILDDGRVSDERIAALDAVAEQWRPRLLRKDAEAYDPGTHTLWVRGGTPASEILTASVLTQRGRVAISMITRPDDLSRDAEALVEVASSLSLSPGLVYRPTAEPAEGSRPLGYGVGALAGMLLVAGWAVAGRMLAGGQLLFARTGAVLVSILVILVLTQGAGSVEAASRSWLLTALVLFLALRIGSASQAEGGTSAPEEPAVAEAVFAHQAAAWSWRAFCLILVLGVIRSMLTSAASTLDFLSLVLALGGTALAAIALVSVRRYGKEGILAPGLVGAALNGLVLVIWIAGLVQA